MDEFTTRHVVRFFNILWDVTDESDDNVTQDDLGLPAEVYMEVDDYVDIENDGADLLSDAFTFCVTGFDYTVLKDPPFSPRGYELPGGDVLGYPDAQGAIFWRDYYGRNVEKRAKKDEGYHEWKRLFEPENM